MNMKKLGVLMAICGFLCLSGCISLDPVPTDTECKEAISDYLLVHSAFYSINDELNLGDWMGIGVQTRSFDWCHTQAPTGMAETYCGVGYINSNGEVTYEGE